MLQWSPWSKENIHTYYIIHLRREALTKVLERLLYLFRSQVEGGVGIHQRRVQPVILLIAEDRVGPQLVDWQLLLQKANNLEFRQVSIVTDIWKDTWGVIVCVGEKNTLSIYIQYCKSMVKLLITVFECNYSHNFVTLQNKAQCAILW